MPNRLVTQPLAAAAPRVPAHEISIWLPRGAALTKGVREKLRCLQSHPLHIFQKVVYVTCEDTHQIWNRRASHEDADGDQHLQQEPQQNVCAAPTMQVAD